MSSSLKELAEKTKQEHDTAIYVNSDVQSALAEFEVEEDESVVNHVDNDEDDDSDDAVIIGGISTNSEDDTADLSEEIASSDAFVLTDEDLKAEMPDLDDPAFKKASSKIRKEIEAFRKDLIIKNGLTPEEANEAATNRMKKLGEEENTEYLKENPNTAIVEIDKKNEKDVVFTAEEREKLRKVKKIELKIVEDIDLKTIEVERIDKKIKTSMLKKIDSGLSSYSVPLPLISDFVTFKGTQIAQLIPSVRFEKDTTEAEMIEKKASLIYNQFVEGSNIKKFDSNGKIILSYEDFCNKFMYYDMDMSLYAIYVASSMEMIETSLTCNQCGSPFTTKYNIKQLLVLDDLPEEFKEKIDTILGHKTDHEYLNSLYTKNNKSVRMKSPITNNIYEIDHPSIRRAYDIFNAVNMEDKTEAFYAEIGIFISSIYVMNNETKKYIEVEEDEYMNILTVLSSLPQEEIELILQFVEGYRYVPKFILKSKCTSCGQDFVNPLRVEDLVFLIAQGSSMETTLLNKLWTS